MVRKGYDYNWLKMVIHGYIYILVISIGLYMNHKWGDLLVLICCKGP